MSIARPRALLVLLLTSVLAFGAVPATSNAAAPAKSKIKTVQVTGKKKTVTIARGKQVRISLATASDGGYAWTVTGKPARSVAKIGKPRVVDGNRNGSVGAPSRTYYRITAKGHGATKIKLVERRPFDHSDVARRVTITVVVRR